MIEGRFTPPQRIANAGRAAYGMASTTGTLVGKVLQEATDLEQFRDSRRRRELFRRGTTALAGIRDRLAQGGSIEARAAYLNQNFITARRDGIDLLCSQRSERKIPSANLVFPTGTMIQYYPNENEQYFDLSDCPDNIALFYGPSFGDGVRYGPAVARYRNNRDPSWGLRIGNDIVTNLYEQQADSQIQHGGVALQRSRLQVLNYDQLRQLWHDPAFTGTVMQGDWHLDSTTAHDVVNRLNLQEGHVLNAIGELVLPNGEVRYYTFSSDLYSLSSTLAHFGVDGAGNLNGGYVTMFEIAANAMAVAQRFGAESWRLCGMELHGGGTEFKTHRNDKGNPDFDAVRDENIFVLTPPQV